ncbi:MAG: restriction endonuclease subunit S, partial [Bacteroidia bacterium]
YHRQLLPLMQGTKVLSISKSSLMKTSLKIPESQNEQEKLGLAFQNIDGLIALHSEKYEKLLNVKKAMLEKMFPKNGADVPEIRFRNFKKDWSSDDIGNVCNITTGSKNTQDNIVDGIYPFFVRSQIVERINSYCFDGEAVLTAGDGVGTGKVFHYINGKFDVHQRVYMMSNFRADVDGYYFYLFFSIHFYARVMQMTAKSSVDSVRKEMIDKMKIKIPEKDEQIKIGKFFYNLNKQISLQELELEKLKIIKKAMLEKMFV